jgi:inosose dehydratase
MLILSCPLTESKGLRFSQLDAAFPLMDYVGAIYGVRYTQQGIRFASELGCTKVDTTDSAQLAKDLTRDEAFKIAVRNYTEVLKWAEDYKIIVNIEPHGVLTNDVEFMYKLLSHFESEYLRFNMDTGNTFIAGNDPLEFLKELRKYLTHMHIKDVSPALAAAARGEETGIACSDVYIGQGVNADNIRKCIEYLKETDWDGDASIECKGTEENIKNSVEWLRSIING